MLYRQNGINSIPVGKRRKIPGKSNRNNVKNYVITVSEMRLTLRVTKNVKPFRLKNVPPVRQKWWVSRPPPAEQVSMEVHSVDQSAGNSLKG